MKNRICVILLIATLLINIIVESFFSFKVNAAMDPIKTLNEQTQESGVDAEIEWQTIDVESAEDIVEIAKCCSLDSWSRNKYIRLINDIHLTDVDFVPFATFGGIFDGNGHSIDGFVLTTNMSYLGFFSKLQPCGIIKNLTVMGNVAPDGKQFVVGGIVGDNYGQIENCSFWGFVRGNDYTGAIAGYNESTGYIYNCESNGTVLGQHYTGGIVGTNLGGIYQCMNKAKVNTSNIDKSLSIEDIKLNQYLGVFTPDENGISEEKSLDSANSTVDTGGIAGHSTGIIEYCTNSGDIGYERVGYNTGGIVGRQSGFVHGCQNHATVLGRKDIGGIVGQAEPNIDIDLTEDIINELSENINNLHDYVEKTLSDMDDSSDKVSDRLGIVKKFVDNALSDTAYLSSETIDYANALTGAGNEALERVDYAVDEAGKENGAVDDAENAMDDVNKASTNLQNAINDSDVKSKMNESDRARYDNDIKLMEEASKEHQGYYDSVYRNNYNYYIYNDSINATDEKSYKGKEDDLKYYLVDSNGDETEYTASMSSLTLNYNTDILDIRIYHVDIDGNKSVFPSTEGEQANYDADLIKDATNDATKESNSYADNQFNNVNRNAPDGTNMIAGTYTYSTYVAKYADDLVSVVEPYAREAAQEARPELENAAKNLSSAAENLSSAVGKTGDIFNDLSSRADITLPTLDDNYKAHTNSFVANMKGMSEHLGYLNTEMNNSSDTVIMDMKDVNDSFNKIMLLFTDAMDGAIDGEYANKFEDESYEVAEECIEGTIADCINEGKVSGDINISGIAGTMGIEYDFDLEGDVTEKQDAKISSTFKTKCVIRKNVNKGRITAQKSYVAGVCGLQEMGTILHSENYGRVSSTTGDYVGGIAGSSISTVKDCYSKGILSGGDYVGGITGYGHDIYECCAIPSILEYDSFAGAIAGEVDDKASVTDNYFVSDSLAGIDRISYSTMAEPLTYKKLLSREEIPEAFKKMQITFLVDDDVVGIKFLEYGQSMMENQYPDSVTEEDYYIDWDTSIVHDVTTDMEIIGEPVLYRTTIASQLLRENKQSVILVDGKFKASQLLDVNKVQGEDIQAVVVSGNTTIEPSDILEHYEVIVPDDGLETHQLRVQLPENNKKADIYIKDGNEYVKIKPNSLGMYQLFNANGTRINVLIVDRTLLIWKYIYIIVVLAITMVIIGVVVLKKHEGDKHKKGHKVKKEKLSRQKEKAKESGKVFIEEKIEKAKQLLEEARDDSPRGNN